MATLVYTLLLMKTLVISAAIEAMNMKGVIKIQSPRLSGTVSKKGLRNGT